MPSSLFCLSNSLPRALSVLILASGAMACGSDTPADDSPDSYGQGVNDEGRHPGTGDGDTNEEPSSGHDAGADPQGDESMPGYGDGDGDGDGPVHMGDGDGDEPVHPGPEPGPIQEVGTPCATELERACAAHNDGNKLLCLDGVWTFNGTCDGNSRCDSRPGATLGTCQGIALECLDHAPSETFCDEHANRLITCGLDLIESLYKPCPVRSTCQTDASAHCQCDTEPDGLGGCVKHAGRYWDNENGTIYDPASKLTWQQVPRAEPYAFYEARSACDGLALDDPRSKGTFRLPSMAELETLRDTALGIPAIDALAFPNTPATYFWSADTEDGYHGTVNLALTFGSDTPVKYADFYGDYLVRCVSGPAPAP